MTETPRSPGTESEKHGCHTVHLTTDDCALLRFTLITDY